MDILARTILVLVAVATFLMVCSPKVVARAAGQEQGARATLARNSQTSPIFRERDLNGEEAPRISTQAPPVDLDKAKLEKWAELAAFETEDNEQRETYELAVALGRAMDRFETALDYYRVAGDKLDGHKLDLVDRWAPGHGSLGANLNNYAPDAFGDIGIARLFELRERLRANKMAASQLAGGQLEHANLRDLERDLHSDYLRAVAGYAPAKEIEGPTRADSSECDVCGDGQGSERWYKLPCGHTYHAQCIIDWARSARWDYRPGRCPLCRGQFRMPLREPEELMTPASDS